MSSDAIITVTGLSKKYRLKHLQERQRYTALRDVLTERAKRLFSRGQKSEVRSPTSDLRPPTSDHSTSEDFWALKDVSFEVKQGEVMGIIGRNGAGKSTLLKILSRITEPTEGRVRIQGRVACLLEVGTGFHPELSGRENIFLNGAILGMSRAEIKSKFDEIVAFAEVERFLDTPVKRYSSGMYVRLAFAVAAHLEPEILVVDEVLAVGDLAFQKKCIGKMKAVSQQQSRTVFFVSHNMGSISQLCSSAILMSAGKVVEHGPTEKVIEAYLRSSFVMKAGGHFEAIPKPGKPGQIISVRLSNQRGETTDQFSCDEPVWIELVIRVETKVQGMYCWIDLTRSDGVLTWMNDSHDASPNPLDYLPPGNHLVKIQIPARTIGHGDYQLNVILTGPLGGATPVDALENVCVLRVEDVSTQRGNQRPGYLSTRAQWSVRELSAAGA